VAGTLTVASDEELIGTKKVPRTDTTQVRRPNDVITYWSGTPTAAGGFTSTTTENALITFDITGIRNMSISVWNRDDEDIDGGGANNTDIDFFIDLCNSSSFDSNVIAAVADDTLGQGVEKTYVLGENLRGWIDTAATPINYDFDGSALVTVVNEGFPFRYVRLSLEAETEDTPAYFEVRAYGLP
jgi:hypothetical protein